MIQLQEPEQYSTAVLYSCYIHGHQWECVTLIVYDLSDTNYIIHEVIKYIVGKLFRREYDMKIQKPGIEIVQNSWHRRLSNKEYRLHPLVTIEHWFMPRKRLPASRLRFLFRKHRDCKIRISWNIYTMTCANSTTDHLPRDWSHPLVDSSMSITLHYGIAVCHHVSA